MLRKNPEFVIILLADDAFEVFLVAFTFVEEDDDDKATTELDSVRGAAAMINA